MKKAPYLYRRKQNGKPTGRYYIYIDRDNRLSTGTDDLQLAKTILEAYKSKLVKGKPSIDGPTVSEYHDKFISSRFDAADRTIEADILAITKFRQSLAYDKPVNSITVHDVENFKIWCKKTNPKIKNSSINVYLRHIRTFLNKAYKLKYLPEKIDIEMLKVGRALPRYLDKSDQEKMFKYSKNHGSPNMREMYRVMMFTFNTGFRRSEVANLDYTDCFEIEGGAVAVKTIGKGNKERVIVLNDDARSVLLSPLPTEGKVFTLKPDYMTHAYKEISRQCKIKDTHFHDMRHTAATELTDLGIPDRQIQELLGHADKSTTQIYQHVMLKHKIKIAQKFNYNYNSKKEDENDTEN